MSRQRGSITKKGEQFYVVLTMPDSAGKRRRKWIPAGPDRNIAMQKLTAELSSLDNGVFVNTGKETLGHFLTRWIETVEGMLTPRTVEGYRTIIKRIVPAIGNIQLRKVGPADLQAYFSTLLGEGGRFDGKGGLSALTVVHHARLLHRALRDAVAWSLIPRNPADLVKAPKAKGQGLAIMNENEIHAFLDASEDYYTLFHCFLYTGARRSELLAVRWSDFDPLLCTLSISRSVHHLHNGQFVFQQTKSAKGKRVISLAPSTVDVLQKHREHMVFQRLELGTMLKDIDLIFSQYDGRPLYPDTISKAWSKLARKLGIPANHLHTARHTHASLLLKQGTHPKIVQERLGHSTISVTLDIYSHVIPGLQEAAAKRFDAALRGDIIKQGVEREVG